MTAAGSYIFPYDVTLNRVWPFFAYIIRNTFAHWAKCSVFLALLFLVFFARIGVAVALGLGVTTLLYLGLIFLIWVSLLRARIHIEISEHLLALRSKLYDKEIRWVDITSVNETRSFVWRGLIQVGTDTTVMTINLPLIKERGRLLEEIRRRIPSSTSMSGAWGAVGPI